MSNKHHWRGGLKMYQMQASYVDAELDETVEQKSKPAISILCSKYAELRESAKWFS
jgi:hypothetical protein